MCQHCSAGGRAAGLPGPSYDNTKGTSTSESSSSEQESSACQRLSRITYSTLLFLSLCSRCG